MRKVTKYVTEDGREHATAGEAYSHEQLLKVMKWYDGNQLFGNVAGSKVDWEDLVDWIRANSEQVMTILRSE